MHTTHRLRKFAVHNLTPKAFGSTVLWALFLSTMIVAMAAFLGRATRNVKAALVDKPDIAIYFLLEEEELGKTTLLRTSEDETKRDYLAETPDGPMLVTLVRGKEQWYVSKTEKLRD